MLDTLRLLSILHLQRPFLSFVTRRVLLSVRIALLSSVYVAFKIHVVQMCTSGCAGYDRSLVNVKRSLVFNILDEGYDTKLPHVRG